MTGIEGIGFALLIAAGFLIGLIRLIRGGMKPIAKDKWHTDEDSGLLYLSTFDNGIAREPEDPRIIADLNGNPER